MTPTMCCPSGVRSNLPLNVVVGRVSVGAGSGDGVVGSAGTLTYCTCDPADWFWSYTARVPCGTPETTPVPAMLMSARPSTPTSTPWGAEVRATVCVTWPLERSITFSDAFPLLVTYRKLPSMDMAPASGVFPTEMVPTICLVV